MNNNGSNAAQDLSKDYLIGFKSVKEDQDSKGRDRVSLSMTQEVAQTVYEELGKLLDNPRGVKLTVHIGDKESGDGRVFRSGFGFIKGIQEFGASRQGSAPTRFQRTGTSSTPAPAVSSIKDRVKKVKEDAGN